MAAESSEAVVDSWSERELDFEDIEGQGKLSVQRNRIETGLDGVEEIGLRPKITHHSSILGTRVYGTVNKVCWGKYKDHLACLLVVRFRFTPKFDAFRLQKAVITIRFDNYKPRGMPNPPATDRSDPILRIFSPRQVYGVPTEVEHEIVWSVAARCSVSLAPASAGPETNRQSTTRYKTQAALEIAGMDEADQDKDLPNMVIFEVDANSKTSRGVPRELYFGAVVECDGPIQADIETNVRDRSAWPWTRDDPIILKPGKEYGEVSSGMTRSFDGLTDDDWKVLVPYQEESTNTVQWRIS